MDPATLALIGAGSQVLSSAVAPRPAAPSTAFSGAPVNSWFDGSGWTVATSSSSAKGGDREQSTPAAPFSPLMIVAAVIGIIAWKMS